MGVQVSKVMRWNEARKSLIDKAPSGGENFSHGKSTWINNRLKMDA
jgi:hypothetical protein